LRAGRSDVPEDEIEQFILGLGGGAKLFDEEGELISRLCRIDRQDAYGRPWEGKDRPRVKNASSRVFVPLAGGILEPSWIATVIP
jgi:hypothetical protein